MERHFGKMAYPCHSYLVPFLLITSLISISVVQSYTVRNSRQAQEEVFEQCKGGLIDQRYCFGTVVDKSSNLKLSKIQEPGGCIELSTCTFLMVIEEKAPGVHWNAYVLSDDPDIQTSGHFEAAFRNKKDTTNGCKPGQNQNDWPAGTLVLNGKDKAQKAWIDKKELENGKEWQGTISEQTDTSGKKFTKYHWETGKTLGDGSNKVEVDSGKYVAYAVKFSSMKKGDSTPVYRGCVGFSDPTNIFAKKNAAGYGQTGQGDKAKDEGEKDSLLWLWILLGLLLLLLLLALIIWLCCCRKKDTVEQQTTSAPTSTTAQEPAPASAAPASAVPSNKPSSAVAPKSSAKPGSSTVGATPGGSTSLRSAYTNIPSGQSTASSNVSARSKMTSLHSSPGSKTGSKVGSKVGSSSSKAASKTPSSSQTSSSSKSATSK